ncbi:hypothetical protein FS749_008457 [Ceratobasidium sp. UAMH 11750]|nr:hypothetical protein FS749_008457 [Ceratobasidium sp. UAMH 11750]
MQASCFVSPNNYALPSLSSSASLGFYFTSLQNVYYYDFDGVVYSIDNQLDLSGADDVYPNPARPDSTFIVGLICHYLDAGFRLYSMRDARDPWVPKPTYDDLDAAKASLQSANGFVGPFPWDAPGLPVMARDLAGESLELSPLIGLNNTIDSPSLAPLAFAMTPGGEPSASGLITEPGADWQNHATPHENPTASVSSHAVTFRSKDDIDIWVNSLKTRKKHGSTPQSKLQCPLKRCGRTIRRPKALKEHLYGHFNIKPYECSHSGCEETFAIAWNRKRHSKTCTYSGTL